MLLFSQKKEIADKYSEWIKENNLKDCAFNVISFLAGSGLLLETMDAVNFIKEETRMCDTYNDCTGCPVQAALFSVVYCWEFKRRYPEKYVNIIVKWSAEHKE